MAQSITPTITSEIEFQAAKVQRLAAEQAPLDLDRLREETAYLQALIAEAARLERCAVPLDDPAGATANVSAYVTEEREGERKAAAG